MAALKPVGSQELVVPNDKTGTLFTAVAHIFCAVVGAGVLGLPNSIAWLGWVAGPLCLLAFFAISMWSSHMLAQLYCVDGIEFARYHHAVLHILGRQGSIAVAIFQCMNLVLTCIAYSITGAIAMKTIAVYLGNDSVKEWQFVLVMGGVELVLSQLPSLEEVWWVSAIGTASSLGYVFIALVLGIAYGDNHGGSIGGRPGTSTANKVFGVLNALGNIAFAYGFAQVLLEIQDTLRQPPRAATTMRKASTIGITGAFIFYFSSAIACYSALGNSVPGEVLQGFEQAPNWIMVVANFCIVIHMVTAWQVWAQPTYETIESNIKAVLIRRQAKRAGTTGGGGATTTLAAAGTAAPLAGGAAGGAAAGAAPATAVAARQPAEPMVSPFDVPQRKLSPHEAQKLGMDLHAAHFQGLPKLPVLAEAELEAGMSGEELGIGGSGDGLRSRRLSVRGSGASIVVNTDPIPSLLPTGGWRRPNRVSGSLGRPAASHDSLAGAGAHLGRTSALSRLSSGLSQVSVALGRTSMYHVDTAAANEEVPMNDQGFYLPLWQRVLIRSTFVMLCTLVACVMPFFSAVVGLVGAVTFFPLTIGFPFLMYAKVFKPAKPILTVMKCVAAVMLVVAVAATIASMQNIIVSWSSYTLFA